MRDTGNIIRIPPERLKIIFILVGLVLFVLATSAGANYAMNQSSFCSVCHEMKPEVATWRGSSHSNVECYECHGTYTENGFNSVRNLISRVDLHLQNTYLLPITLDTPLPNSKCLSCHSLKRHVSPSGDLIIPHERHDDKKIGCTECHSGIAHGNIAFKQLTIDGNFVIWNDEYGKDHMSSNFTGLSMKACMDCHRIRKVNNNCETCHKEIVKPDDHKTPEWLRQHGKLARQDIGGCDRCHSATSGPKGTKTADPVAVYVQGNTLCWQCHQKIPDSHSGNWGATHGTKARIDKKGCFTCHSQTRPLANFTGAKTFCMDCHKGKHRQFNREVHPIPVPPGVKPNITCGKCHGLKVCSKCHVTLNTNL